MWLIDRMAEQRIQEAIAKGELDDLPGAGRPLPLEDDLLVPEELRADYRLLKNAGYIPPELAWRREIQDLRQLLDAATRTEEERRRLGRRLNYLLARLSDRSGGHESHLAVQERYLERLQARFDPEARQPGSP